MAKVDFYYDVVCPYAYLGSTQIGRICDAAQARLTWKPMLLGGVFRSIGNPDRPQIPENRVRGNARDLARWANARGVELRFPPGHPRRSVEAMRLLTAASMSGDRARLEALTHALYRAYWVEGQDVADRAVLARIGAAHAVPIESVDREDVKARLREVTDEAVRGGAFGAPSMFVEDDRGDRRLWFGQDRLHFVERALGLPPPRPAPSATPTGRTVEFLFDYSSPFTYLASTQIERVARERGATVVWRPILLGGLFKEIGNPIVPILEMSEARRRYLRQDLLDWAGHWGVPFQWPSRFPMATVTALRMSLAAPAAELPRLAHALFRAFWVEDRDLNDKATLQSVADRAGFDGAALLARTADPAIKGQLLENTSGAVRRGVYGAPSFFVRDELFFGQDRLDQVAEAL